MIEDEIDGIVPGKADPVIARAHATLPDPDLDPEGFGDVDALGAIELFDEFPWAEHSHEAATRKRLGVVYLDPSLWFAIRPYHIDIQATDREGIYNVAVCLPSPGKFLGIFRSTQWYEARRASARSARGLILAFFETSLDRRREGIEAIIAEHAAATQTR